MYEYAGMHWPNGPETLELVELPSPLLLMLASEARFHYDDMRKAGKTVIWRALPRVGKRPAELNYNIKKCVDEVMNLWDEQPHYKIEWFVPYNELDLNYERGDNNNDFDDLSNRYALFSGFLEGMAKALRSRLPNGTNILFPPFTPDHGDRENIERWRACASLYDGLVVHVYEDADRIRERLEWYLREFPEKPIFLGEWNGPNQKQILETLADLQAREPHFMGATYFAWHWYDAPSHWPESYNVDQNDDLYQLFKNPPSTTTTAEPPEREPMTKQEVIDLICRKADQYGLVREEFLAGAIAESGLDPTAERWGEWPDVSFGLFQQTVKFADEGDHSDSEENIKFIQNLYNNPEHACDMAAPKYKYWRYEPDVDPIRAWCAYNYPASYKLWPNVPNSGQKANYEVGLRKAKELLGVQTMSRIYGSDIPGNVILQHNDWSCAVRSTYAALWDMAQQGQGEAVTYGDDGPRDVYNWMVPEYDSSADGLKEASGAGLVRMLASHGYTAHATNPVSLAQVQAVAGTKPVLLGGRAWNHWVYCKGVDDDGVLQLANPAPGHMGISNILRDSFDSLGPFSMVEIDLPTTSQPEPEPQPESTPATDDEIKWYKTVIGHLAVDVPASLRASVVNKAVSVNAKKSELVEAVREMKADAEAVAAELERHRLTT